MLYCSITFVNGEGYVITALGLTVCVLNAKPLYWLILKYFNCTINWNEGNACENVSYQMVTILSQSQCVNSLWPRDAIWRHGSRSTLDQAMAWCLSAPSHYLNQCSLIIWTNVHLSSVKSCHIHLRVISQEILKRSIHDMSFKNTNSWSHLHLPGSMS